MTYSPVSANPQTASYNQPPSQRGNAAIATMQNQPQHGALAYADSYSSHTPTHSGQFHATPPSYQDPSVATHYSPAPLPTPQSHDVSRHMSEDLTENCDEDAQGEPADESTEPNVEELDAELMVDMLLSDDESWAQIRGYTEGFKEWEDQWKKAGNGKSKKSKDERERLEFELLRAGLGNGRPEEGFNGYRYSFCQGQWVPTHLWDHCVECQICRSSDDWHCHKHERCTEGRVCSGCASTTLPYHPQQQQQPRESMYPAQGS
ncbi:hypothetical protein NUW58_g7863 [Xylaria curta]|uniref:Uncharacterized protein n=1 Tax=Xylaria curta TaxID=42375 RepID=A0ACC1NFX0_9PEZI|nr:hypothetical protein NUW58_g7863 [Xylaria curta]